MVVFERRSSGWDLLLCAVQEDQWSLEKEPGHGLTCWDDER